MGQLGQSLANIMLRQQEQKRLSQEAALDREQETKLRGVDQQNKQLNSAIEIFAKQLAKIAESHGPEAFDNPELIAAVEGLTSMLDTGQEMPPDLWGQSQSAAGEAGEIYTDLLSAGAPAVEQQILGQGDMSQGTKEALTISGQFRPPTQLDQVYELLTMSQGGQDTPAGQAAGALTTPKDEYLATTAVQKNMLADPLLDFGFLSQEPLVKPTGLFFKVA